MPPLIVDEGVYLLEVVQEPDRPIVTKFGEQLVYNVKGEDGEAKAFFIPFREAASEDSAVGQLKILTEKGGGSLEGKRLKVIVAGKGRDRRYSFSVVEQSKMKKK